MLQLRRKPLIPSFLTSKMSDHHYQQYVISHCYFNDGTPFPIHDSINSTINTLRNRLEVLYNKISYYDHLINTYSAHNYLSPSQSFYEERDYISELIYVTENNISFLRNLHILHPVRPIIY